VKLPSNVFGFYPGAPRLALKVVQEPAFISPGISWHSFGGVDTSTVMISSRMCYGEVFKLWIVQVSFNARTSSGCVNLETRHNHFYLRSVNLLCGCVLAWWPRWGKTTCKCLNIKGFLGYVLRMSHCTAAGLRNNGSYDAELSEWFIHHIVPTGMSNFHTTLIMLESWYVKTDFVW
jgi:hypothetical protein